MYRSGFSILSLTLVVSVAGLVPGCRKAEEPKAETAPVDVKIPITTSSEEARKHFLAGRDLAEKLLATNSLEHFDQAIALDPKFALAELSRANVSPTAKEFFDHLGKAVALSAGASNGEKLLILGTEAGANGNPVKQLEYLEQLMAAYPSDERAHFTMGGYYFGQQEFAKAIEHYQESIRLNPSYSPVYNIIGYAYRQIGDYPNAEQAFQKYIELIPGDPNPYDSYAELLLKMGKFPESIAQYQKALTIDPSFVGSHSGIAMDLAYMGKPAEAVAEAQKIADKARTDGERRTALFTLTVIHADGGKMNDALADVDKQYALGEKSGDIPAMAGDLQLKGNILAEMGKAAEAQTAFEQALKMTGESNLSQEIKDNARLVHHQNLTLVALAKKDMTTAKTEAEAFAKGAEANRNPGQIRQAHGLNGRIALEAKDYDTAIAELQAANQQDPYDLYRLCLAQEGKGDHTAAKAQCTKAAQFNSLPLLNYAFVRTKAQKMTDRIKG